MDTARIKSIAVLGYNFNLHLLRSLIPGRRKKDQAELFRGYFRDDRITGFTDSEHRDLVEFGGCVACGLCPSHCRVMELTGGRFKGPMDLALAASRSHPEFVHDLDSIILCAACGQCEPVCPERVPMSRIAMAMRFMLWRVAPESFPPAWHAARENLAAHGDPAGAAERFQVPLAQDADCALVLGPALARRPKRATMALGLLQKLGYKVTGIREGTIGGVGAGLGLEPDASWVEQLRGDNIKTIIAADPEVWLALRRDGRVSGKGVKFIIEAVVERWPDGQELGVALSGAAIHYPYPLARGPGMVDVVEGFLAGHGAELVLLSPGGELSPPLGWEGGAGLVDPGLARGLCRARLEDARRAGASRVLTLCASDQSALEGASEGGGPLVSDLVEILFDLLKG